MIVIALTLLKLSVPTCGIASHRHCYGGTESREGAAKGPADTINQSQPTRTHRNTITDLDDINLEPDRKRIRANRLEPIVVNLSCGCLLCRLRRRREVAGYRWKNFGRGRGM